MDIKVGHEGKAKVIKFQIDRRKLSSTAVTFWTHDASSQELFQQVALYNNISDRSQSTVLCMCGCKHLHVNNTNLGLEE